MSLATNNEGVIAALRALGESVLARAKEGLASGQFNAATVTYLRERIDSAYELEGALRRGSWDIDVQERQSWFNAIVALLEGVERSAEYARAAEVLSTSTLPGHSVPVLLHSVTSRVGYEALACQDDCKTQTLLGRLLDVVAKHLENRPLEFWSEIRLEGVVPPANGMTFRVGDAQYDLRRAAIEDLPSESLHPSMFSRIPAEDPSAIMRLSFLGEFGYEIQRRVEQAVTILRLFKVGGVRAISYTIESESLTDVVVGGRMQAGTTGGGGRYGIDDAEVQILERFWNKLAIALPLSGFASGKLDMGTLGIAYDRYSDALLAHAKPERRIADAVMGLEALFLSGDENQELAYRLRMRMAKLLGLIGRDPHLEKQVANDAYSVRSAYVHGDTVRGEREKGIRKRQDSLQGLLARVLDQLRVAIVVFLTVGMSKPQMIKLIDDSFIDPAALALLENAVSMISESAGFTTRS